MNVFVKETLRISKASASGLDLEAIHDRTARLIDADPIIVRQSITRLVS